VLDPVVLLHQVLLEVLVQIPLCLGKLLLAVEQEFLITVLQAVDTTVDLVPAAHIFQTIPQEALVQLVKEITAVPQLVALWVVQAAAEKVALVQALQAAQMVVMAALVPNGLPVQVIITLAAAAADQLRELVLLAQVVLAAAAMAIDT
jgi:RPA family protein